VRGVAQVRWQPRVGAAARSINLSLRQKDGTGEVGTADIGTAQIGPDEIGGTQIRAAQIGTHQVRPPQTGTPQIGLRQPSTDEVGTAQIATRMSRAYEGARRQQHGIDLAPKTVDIQLRQAVGVEPAEVVEAYRGRSQIRVQGTGLG